MIIKNANIFRNGKFEQSDVLFDEKQILKIGKDLDTEGEEVKIGRAHV